MDRILIQLISIGVLGFTNSIAENLKLKRTEQITKIGLVGTISYSLIDASLRFYKEFIKL